MRTTLSPSRRVLARAALLALAGVSALVAPAGAGAAAAGQPVAAAARTCDVTAEATTLGPTSVRSLSATRTTCGKAKRLVTAFYACRVEKGKGPSGRCVRRVRGYACREIRTTPSPAEFSARVTCTKGRATVKHSYTQTT